MAKFYATKITWVSRDGNHDFPIKTPVELVGENIWGQANAYLRCWTFDIPECSQGSWKTDFVVNFNNGDTYKGTYDLYRKESNSADLAKHIQDYQTIYLADYKPSIIESEDWQEAQQRAKHLLYNYELPQGQLCIYTWWMLTPMVSDYPVIVNYGDCNEPTRLLLKGMNVWVKIDYSIPQGSPSQVHDPQNKTYSFAFAKDGKYERFPGVADNIYQVAIFARSTLVD